MCSATTATPMTTAWPSPRPARSRASTVRSSLAANGSWTYTLNNADGDTNALAQGEAATDVFNYTITDGHGGTASSTLTINITGTNDAPAITARPQVRCRRTRTSQATGQLSSGDPDHGAQDTLDRGGRQRGACGGLSVRDRQPEDHQERQRVLRRQLRRRRSRRRLRRTSPTAMRTLMAPPARSARAAAARSWTAPASGPALGVGTPDEFVGHFATVRSNIDPSDPVGGLKIDRRLHGRGAVRPDPAGRQPRGLWHPADRPAGRRTGHAARSARRRCDRAGGAARCRRHRARPADRDRLRRLIRAPSSRAACSMSARNDQIVLRLDA